ncbi:MAG TPA: cell division protein ZapE [Arenimonas sp.]|nr:cell division protein ZapE [Arenimonas sp.]
MNGPASRLYQANVHAGLIQADAAQQRVLAYLDRMAVELRENQPRRIFGLTLAKPKTVKGLYLWGGVGRGKTLLPELFLQSIDGVPHQRWHFHRFMNHVHQQLACMPDTADTLAVLAKSLSRKCRLLVLDEFFVSDIGDAMILYRLLEQLLGHGVSFITTSNVPPDELYLNGLQRASFLPCIELLKHGCEVVELLSAQDYRLRTLSHAATYITPNDEAGRRLLGHQYSLLSGQPPAPDSIDINQRPIPALALSAGVAWFAFSALCEGPRSAADYIEIARDFHTVLISDVPRFDGRNEDAARRFVYLIDELYDRHVNVLLSAEADAFSLYQGHRLPREFERTSSRLAEMQSKDYLALEHRP